MKNFFKKFRSYSFWISLSGALVLIFNCFGRVFGFKIENQVVEDVIMTIAGALVMLGIVIMDVDTKSEKNEDETTKKDDEKDQKEDE